MSGTQHQSTPIGLQTGELKKIAVFSDLSEEKLRWLVEHAVELRLNRGDALVQEGDEAKSMFVLLEGEIHGRRERENGGLPMFIAVAGQVTGLLPYSRLTHFGGTARAVVPSRILCLGKEYFTEMLQVIPELGPRLVGLMSDRIREVSRREQQRDKLLALGKLSAGLAHELNNPASAVHRAAENLREPLQILRSTNELTGIRGNHWKAILDFEDQAIKGFKEHSLGSLQKSDLEEELAQRLTAMKVADVWSMVPELADHALTFEQLEKFASDTDGSDFSSVLRRVTASLAANRLLCDIDGSISRVVELVRSIKSYSYMDRGPLQEVKISDGIESTLTMLGHKLKKGITVVRDYDPELPTIIARGSELNQLWTNLIDNATDAMGEEGVLTITTRSEPGMVLVEIRDNGPGVPPELQSKIFEPFFTTKGVGDGTGLGLEIVMNIVRSHQGDIKLLSKPGETRFQVRLPIAQES